MTPTRRDLSPMQLSLLYEALLAPGRATHVGPGVCVLDGALDRPAFERAWREIVARHELLRTSFEWSDLERPVRLLHDDVRPALGHHERPAGDLVERERARPFDLARAPLFRVVTAAVGGRTWCFVAASDVLLDAWSATAVLHEALDVYAALCSGALPRVPPRPAYDRHVELVGDHDLTAAERFWRARLAEPAAGLPEAACAGAQARGLDTVPVQADAAALRRLAAARGCHLSTIVAAAWAVVLSRHAGAGRVRFGLRTDGRLDGPDGVEPVLGPLATTVPLSGTVDEDGSLGAHLAAWRAVEVESVRFAYTPAAMLRRWAGETAPAEIDTEVAIADPDGRLAALAAHDLVRELLPPPEPGLGADRAAAVRWDDHGGRLTYRPDRLSRPVAARLAAHLGTLLANFATAGDRPLGELSMLTGEEARRVVVDCNQTRCEFDARPIHRPIEEQALRTPAAAAVDWRGRATSYAELDRAAGRWAASFRSLGVGPDTVVGVHWERSPELVAILLGVLRAGGAYLPLDPAHPPERLAYMARDAGALAVASSRPDLWQAGGVATLSAPGGGTRNGGEPETPLDALAYVLYTSGSTGVPKGVAISHRSAANLLHWARATLGPDLRRVLATTSIGFDCSVVEIFGTLAAGGTVVLAESLLDAPGLDAGVRLVNGVPSALLELARAGRLPGSVRTVMAGGEAVPAELVEALHRRPHVGRVLNVYGPAEATTYATAGPVPRGGERPAIGRPLPNTAVYICDPRRRPVPAGVPGELYIGGVGLARGYLGHPDLTADRFVPDHLGATPGGRLYRTGDLARRRDDGAIEFLGRIDRQVKVRGHRVEPEEVRAALAGHPSVRSAAVGPWDDGAGGGLVAYVVPNPGREVDPDELRDHLARSLPAFMIPAHVVPVERLPLLPNGKVDWRSLPAPAPRSAPADHPAAPRTADEAALLAIWRDLLELEPRGIGTDEDFFELGGHSLLLMRLQSRVRDDLGVDVPLRLLFESRTIRSLALALALLRNADARPAGDGEEEGEV